MGAAIKLTAIVSGAVLASLLLISLIWGGCEEIMVRRLRNVAAEEEFQTGTLRAREEAENVAALGASRIDNVFFELENLFRSSDPLASSRDFFRSRPRPAALLLVAEIRGTVHLIAGDSVEEHRQELLKNGSRLFRYAGEKAGSKRYCICGSASDPGTFWILYLHDRENRAALRLSGPLFLRSLVPQKGKNGAVTGLARGRNLLAFRIQPDPEHRMSVPEIRETLLEPEKMVLRQFPGQMPPMTRFNGEYRWYNASLPLKTTLAGDTGIRVFRSLFSAGQYQRIPEFCRHVSSGTWIAALLPAGAVFFGILLPVLLLIFRNHGRKLRSLRDYAAGIADGRDPGSAPHGKGDRFFREFSETLTLLRERFRSALDRLKETRDREMKLLKEADDTRLLRNGMLEEIVSDMRSSLQLAAGYSNLQAGRMDPDTPEGDAAREIASSLRHLTASLNGLEDLARLTRIRNGIVRKELNVPFLMRYAVDTAGALSAARGLVFETGGAPSAEQKFFSSPEILFHLLFTSLSLIADSAARNSRVVLTCLTDREELLFLCRSLRDGDFSDLADLYDTFSRIGMIPKKEYSSSILRLKVLSEEASLIGGELKVFRPEEGGSAILLDLPFRELKPENGIVPEEIRRTGTGRKVIRRSGIPVTVCAVTDSPEERKLISLLLSGSGYMLTFPDSREKALELMKARKFDILLLDGGEELLSTASYLRQVPGSAAVALMLSSFAADPAEYARNGVDLCLLKPLSAARLREAFFRLEE